MGSVVFFKIYLERYLNRSFFLELAPKKNGRRSNYFFLGTIIFDGGPEGIGSFDESKGPFFFWGEPQRKINLPRKKFPPGHDLRW